MKTDLRKFRELLTGTPMEGLSNSQINEVIIGEYPLTISSKHLKAIWDSVISDDGIDIENLKFIEIDSLLEAMALKTMKNSNLEQYEKIETIRRYLKKSVSRLAVINTQSVIIKQQEEDLLRYEIEVRQLREQLRISNKEI